MQMTLREQFDSNVKSKAVIGIPFTIEDVAETLGVPSSDLRSSWLVPFRDKDMIRNTGTQRSRNKKHNVIVWCGSYALDMEAEEENENETTNTAA